MEKDDLRYGYCEFKLVFQGTSALHSMHLRLRTVCFETHYSKHKTLITEHEWSRGSNPERQNFDADVLFVCRLAIKRANQELPPGGCGRWGQGEIGAGFC